MKKTLFYILTIFTCCSTLCSADATSIKQNSQNILSEANYLSARTDGLKPAVAELAVRAYYKALEKGVHVNKKVVTIIDYSLPSSEKRLWVLDLQNNNVLFHTFVAHGKYSGTNISNQFSNNPGSQQSSIGVYLTEGTYSGRDGYSLMLKGLEKGYNDRAESRRIVMHGAYYVGDNMVKMYGRIGRSWGCPAVEKELAEPIINTIKNGSLILAYYPDQQWLTHSAYLNVG